MPDFSVIPPLVETVDRRGQNLIAGVGNANMSSIGSFIEGMTRTAADVTNIRAKQLETQRLNNPARLMAEQVRRDLENKKIEDALRVSRINQLTLDSRNRAALDATRANTAATRASTTATNIDNRTRAEANRTRIDYTQSLTETNRAAAESRQIQNERQRKETDIFLTQADELAGMSLEERREASATALEESRAARSYRRRRAELGLQEVEDQTAILSELLKVQKELSSIGDSDTRRKQELIDKHNKMIKDEEQRLNSWRPESVSAKQQKKEQEKVFQEWSRLPDLSEYTDERKTPQQEMQEKLQERTQTLMQRMLDVDASAKSRDVGSQEIALDIQQRRETESNSRIELIRDVADTALRTAQQDRAADGTPGIKASLSDVLKLTEYSKSALTPTEQQAAATSIQEVFRELGGEERVLEYLDNNVENPQTRKALKAAVYESLVATGQVDKIKPMQQDMLQAGLTPEDISDPDKVFEDLSTLLSGRGSQVENPRLKSLRKHPYFSRAMAASKKNTQGFTIYNNASSQSNSTPAADVAGGDSETYNALVFEGDDGTMAQAALPQTPQDEALWNVLEALGEKSQVIQGDNRKAAAVAEQARQTGGIKAPPPPPQQPTQPAAPDIRAQFNAKVQQAVERAEQRFQSQSGKPYSDAQRKVKIREAQAMLFQRLTPAQQQELQQGR